MRQRGRQSGAGLEIIPPASAGPNLQPPRHLIATEARLFHEVVANAPPGQFSASDVYLLATFAQVTLLALKVLPGRRQRPTIKPGKRVSKCSTRP
jgi:hypothetical protein